MKWINCNDQKKIAVDAVVRQIGYTDTMTASRFKDYLNKRLINAVDYEWLDESPSPSIEELAQKLRAANPFIGDIESIEDKRIGWNECIQKLLELSKQQP